MEPTLRFRVLIEEDIKKLVLKNGMPLTVEELVAAVKEAFSITEDASLHLQYKDEDFDDFFTLTSTNELSVDSQDTVILSPSPSERQNAWPQVFPIPTFSHNTELALRQGN